MGGDVKYSVEMLQKGRVAGKCCRHILDIDPLNRTMLYNTLTFERLERKNRDIITLYHEVNDDWNQTLYTLLFRIIGGTENKAPFDELSRRATHQMVTHEIASKQRVEALLLGTAGILQHLPVSDSYIAYLHKEFEYLCYKYNIEPLDATVWTTKNIYPNNHPIVRILQLAACLCLGNITVYKSTLCTKRQDVYRYFEGRVTEDWIQRLARFKILSKAANRIGHTKSDILGINLIAQINFAYGNYINSDKMIDNAIALLEDIPVEDNRYTRRWNSIEQVATNAYEGQAVLQLSREYCENNRCHECPLGTMLCNKKR